MHIFHINVRNKDKSRKEPILEDISANLCLSISCRIAMFIDIPCFGAIWKGIQEEAIVKLRGNCMQILEFHIILKIDLC